MFVNRTNVKSLDVAQVGDTLYYFSADFLTFKQSDFHFLFESGSAVAETRVPGVARVSLVAGLSYLGIHRALQRRK